MTCHPPQATPCILRCSLRDRDKLFFWIDSFDPHEPWNPPAPYDTMYTDRNYAGKRLIDANYSTVDYMSPEELAYIKGMCAGEVNKLRDVVVTGYHTSAFRCVRDERWSLLVHPEGRHELYDLVDDAREKVNLFGKRKDVAQRLLKQLGFFSYTKQPPTQYRNVQEAYEWAHTSME